MAKNDSRTRAFDTAAKPKSKKKSYKSKKRVRQQVVISIFAVIALILVVFATLIIGKIITLKKNVAPTQNPPSIYTVPCASEDIHKGNLLLINSKYQFDYNINNLVSSSYSNPPDGLVNLWAFKNNAHNNAETKVKIPGTDIYAPTYELASRNLANQICLDKDTLNKFNQLMLDYCNTLDLSSYTSGSASKINIAWGWSHETDLLENDLPKYGEAFYEQATGKSLTLKQVKDGNEQITITEKILKNNFSWIYDNAHKYGFIIAFPDGCNHHNLEPEETGSVRVHLRYIGVEHATYIYKNGCCLEEYLKLLRENHGSNNPLEFSANGKTYSVYYVASSGNPTNVPVPEDKTYYISGDNMNGFIVTVEK